jgi:signal transduction histidine kinase
MELHGGKISAASTGKGTGATFRIEIKTVQD